MPHERASENYLRAAAAEARVSDLEAALREAMTELNDPTLVAHDGRGGRRCGPCRAFRILEAALKGERAR